jgi:crossover junction endodeoxyribonuclease RuvC
LIIIGVDPGTVVTGYGVVVLQKDGRYSVLDYGCIRPPPQWKLTDRYAVIYDGIGELLDKYHPEHLVVETQYVRINPRSAIVLGMARGVIIVRATKHRPKPVAIYEYSPNQAKRSIVGNGKASKQQVQGMVKQVLKLATAPPSDAADALALCVCHAHALHYAKQLGKEL